MEVGQFHGLRMDKDAQKQKILGKAQDLKKKALETALGAKKKALEAKNKVDAYAAKGQKQRITVLIIAGIIVLGICALFYNQAIQYEGQESHYACVPTKNQDCKRYEKIRKLWQPYRDKPYNIPQDEESE